MFIFQKNPGLAPFVLGLNPGVCSADDGDGSGDGDGGGGGGDEPKFTQADMDKAIQSRLSKAEKKYAGFDEFREKAGKVDALTAEIEELRQQIDDAGKSAEEKERARAARERATLDKQLATLTESKAELEAAIEAERTAHRTTRASHDLMAALTQSDVHAKAAGDALRTMMSDSELEFAEDGSLESLTLRSNGVRYGADKLKDAAAAFLEDRPYFAKAPPGGPGIAPPSGGGGGGGDGRARHEMSTDELLARDARRRSA
jgi:hypothetical protein